MQITKRAEFLPRSIFPSCIPTRFSSPPSSSRRWRCENSRSTVFTRRSSKRLEWWNLHAGLNRLHRMAFVRQTWHIALRQNGSLSPFSRAEDGRALSGCNGRKGILKYEQELRQKGPVCIHTRSILRRCTIVAARDYASLILFIRTDYRHRVWLWHFNRRVEISHVKSRVQD